MDASQQTCPKCGWAREPNAVDCPACGIVYARFTGAPSRPSPARTDSFAPPPPPRSSQPANPYAPPKSEVEAVAEAPVAQMYGSPGGAGVWRTGNLLVMQKGMSLPNRCLLCNQPASVQLPRKMYWHHAGLYLLLFLGGPVLYMIAALVARKKADVVVPLCTPHAEKRKKLVVTASLMALSGLALTLGSCAIGEGNVFGVMILAGFALLIIGGLVSIVASNMIVPKKIDDYYVWINKVSASYLAALPQAPPGL